MSSAIYLIPEYRDEYNIWRPFFKEQNKEIWFQGNMRDCLAHVSWTGERNGTLVKEINLTEDEINLLKGTYSYEGCVGYDDNGKPIIETQNETFNYIPYTYSITIDELYLLVDKIKQEASEALKDKIKEYKDAYNDITLAKIALCGAGKQIPDEFRNNLFETENELENFIENNDYGYLDDYVCITAYCNILTSLGRIFSYEELRYLFYIN